MGRELLKFRITYSQKIKGKLVTKTINKKGFSIAAAKYTFIFANPFKKFISITEI